MPSRKFTDQPGRILAVFVFGPLLVYKGAVEYKYDNFLILFGLLLIAWDFYWIVKKTPATS